MHAQEQNFDPFASDKAKQPVAQLQSSLLPDMTVDKSFPLWGGLVKQGSTAGLVCKSQA